MALVGATGRARARWPAFLPRLVDPDAGQVLVGSDEGGWRDVKALDLTKLRRRVHVVPQDVFLFSDTVSANLRLGARDASEADVQRALRLACAEEIVAGLPEGLGTVIGDRGATLSGGQRQRLTLARAFVGRPALLALDDATSALDAITERAILDRLRDIGSEGRPPLTLLLVAANFPRSCSPTVRRFWSVGESSLRARTRPWRATMPRIESSWGSPWHAGSLTIGRGKERPATGTTAPILRSRRSWPACSSTGACGVDFGRC